MTRETALYIGIVGLSLSVINLLRPYIYSLSTKLIQYVYQTKIFHEFNLAIEKQMLAKGSSKQQLNQYKNHYYNLFWIFAPLVVYIALYFKNFMFLLLLIIYPYLLFRKCRTDVMNRNQVISKTFPYFLDIFTLSIESGMDSIRAIKEISKTDPASPLNQELIWVTQSTQIGQSLPVAMMESAKRTGCQELYTLAHSIAQSTELGSSLSGILRLQSKTLREKIFKDAQTQAQKAPVKILFPLVFCIFPVVFIILFVPIAINLFAMMG